MGAFSQQLDEGLRQLLLLLSGEESGEKGGEEVFSYVDPMEILPGLWGGDRREQPPMPFAVGDGGLPSPLSSCSTKESMMPCRSLSMELTRESDAPSELLLMGLCRSAAKRWLSQKGEVSAASSFPLQGQST